MRKLRIGIIDIVSRGPTRSLYARVMNANFASIMPQVIGAWCREEGHDVAFFCYTGFEDLLKELPDNVDLVFISPFTEAAQKTSRVTRPLAVHRTDSQEGSPHQDSSNAR